MLITYNIYIVRICCCSRKFGLRYLNYYEVIFNSHVCDFYGAVMCPGNNC